MHPILARAFSATRSKMDWKVFVDLQCPYAKRAWRNLPAITERFGSDYEFSMHLTSLVFHPQAFVGQRAAFLIGTRQGPQAKQAFVNACFKHQDTFTNEAVGDARKSEVEGVFADIADKAGVLDESFTRDDLLSNMNDWETVVKPAYDEHKVALGYGVFGTPKHVINEKLVPDTESSWGPDEFEEHLRKLQIGSSGNPLTQ